jgi:hypothetical protein
MNGTANGKLYIRSHLDDQAAQGDFCSTWVRGWASNGHNPGTSDSIDIQVDSSHRGLTAVKFTDLSGDSYWFVQNMDTQM